MHPARVRVRVAHAILCFALLAPASPAHADHPSAGFGDGAGGPIQGLSAGTLPAGGFSFSLRAEYLEFRRFSDEDLL